MNFNIFLSLCYLWEWKLVLFWNYIKTETEGVYIKVYFVKNSKETYKQPENGNTVKGSGANDTIEGCNNNWYKYKSWYKENYACESEPTALSTVVGVTLKITVQFTFTMEESGNAVLTENEATERVPCQRRFCFGLSL